MSVTIFVSKPGAFQALGQNAVSLPRFEVASIKAHVVTAGRSGGNMANLSRDPGRIAFQATSAKGLIQFAYDFPAQRIDGSPQWLDEELYDVAATTSAPATLQEQKLMLQSLLAERFGLAVNRTSKEGPVYALVAGKKPNLVKSERGDGFEVARFSSKPTAQKDGSFQLVYLGKHVSMSDLAGWLSAQVGRPVFDRTGIEGLYDIELPGPTLEVGASIGGPEQFIPALRDRLGLDLESQRGNVETLVIEHIDKPSSNE